MSTKWLDMSLRDFQSALASSSPTPGGGTAAAVALGQASALTLMVCDLTIGNEKWKDGWDVAEKAVMAAIKIMSRAGDLADEDSDSFEKVMQSFKLPKNNENEIQNRRNEIRSCTLVAAEVPLETATIALELMELLPELAKRGNTNAASDVGVAGLLASAACKGALFNVKINLDSLPSEMGEDLRSKVPEIQERSRIISRMIMDEVRDAIGSD